MSNIYKFHLSERDTTGYYVTGYPIAVDIKEQFEEMGFECSTVDKPYGTNNAGHFYVQINDTYRLDITTKGSSNIDYYVKDNSNTLLSDTRSVRICSLDGYQTDVYMCLIMFNDKIVVGFNGYDSPIYLFAFGFLKHLNVDYWYYIPYNVSGYNSTIQLYNGLQGVGTLKQLFNINVNEQYKGLFNNMLLTDGADYTDINNPVADIYCIKTSYPFNNYSTFKINGVEFYALNKWTVLRIEDGAVIPNLI